MSGSASTPRGCVRNPVDCGRIMSPIDVQPTVSGGSALNRSTPPRLVVLNIETLKSYRTIVSVAMSNQIEDDEIEQPVTKAANPETALCVNINIVGDLLIGELDSWHLGICEVVKDDDDLLVCGENGQVVERVDTDVWTTTTLFDGIEVKDLSKIADTINGAIASEYDEL